MSVEEQGTVSRPTPCEREIRACFGKGMNPFPLVAQLSLPCPTPLMTSNSQGNGEPWQGLFPGFRRPVHPRPAEVSREAFELFGRYLSDPPQG